MPRFIKGQDRQQVALIPECLDDFIADDNPVRIVDAFVDELNLESLGFERAAPAATGRPSYHPAVWRQTSRPSPISAVTMARAFAMCAGDLWPYAEISNYSPKP